MKRFGMYLKCMMCSLSHDGKLEQLFLILNNQLSCIWDLKYILLIQVVEFMLGRLWNSNRFSMCPPNSENQTKIKIW